MKLKLYWGLGVLSILLIGISVVLMLWTTKTEPTSDVSSQPTDVVSELLSVDREFDLAVKLPTDAELPMFNARELSILEYEAITELSKVQDKYVALTSALRETRLKNLDDYKAGVIDSKPFWAKQRELLNKDKELTRVYQLIGSEKKERIKRMIQYRDTLE